MYKYTLYAWTADDEGGLAICLYDEFSIYRGYRPETGWRAQPSVKIGDFNTAEELANLAEITTDKAQEWIDDFIEIREERGTLWWE